MLNRYTSLNFLKIKVVSAALLGIMAFMIVFVAAPQVKADTANDVAAGLQNNRYYVTNDVKADSVVKQKYPNIDSDIKNIVNRVKSKKDVRVAVISNQILPPTANTTQSYTNFLLNYLSPKPDALIVVNQQTSQVYVASTKLSDSEIVDLTNSTLSSFTAQGTVNGISALADKVADKISSNATGSLLTTIGIVVIVILIIGGVVAYLLISTKNNWTKKVKGVEQLADQVSTLVLKVSDDVNFLPDADKAKTNADFGAATQNFSEANTRLRELQKVSPVTLLLQGADYQRKLDLTGAQFQQAQQSLTRVEQQVRSLPGI
jgi:hypothetical protein